MPLAFPRLVRKSAVLGLSAVIFSLEVASDLTPVVRMTGRRRLPHHMSAGILGAEVATWAAISPSLLPRPWWVTAANVAIVQAAGHAGASAAAAVLKGGLSAARKRPQDRVGLRTRKAAHLALGTITVGMGVLSLHNQTQQAQLVGKINDRGPKTAALGALAGTVGYGGLLITGQALRATVSSLSHQAQRWLPSAVAWPLASGVVGFSIATLSDRLLWRQFIKSMSLRAERINRRVFPDSIMPWEPERSGSPWSFEPWTAVGAQGRRFLTRGPRALDIKEVLGCEEAHEPIRIFIGLVPGRGMRGAAQLAFSELQRAGAFHRNTLVIQMPAGSGWLNNYSVSAYEFLTHGDCATVTVQYSVLPSVFAFPLDRETPVRLAGELMELIRSHIGRMDRDNRPKIYLAGESLGSYAVLENFDSAEALLDSCDGAVFTGPPRMTPFMRRLSSRRELGSLERLPLIDGGRHIRFAAVPQHLHHDAFGRRYQQKWEHPRVVFSQHASDAIVWWDFHLLLRRPDWLAEPSPITLHADTFRYLVWLPFITFWQVALDQLNSLNVPGGHGHNYFEEVFYYWEAVLGNQSRTPLSPEKAARMQEFIKRTQPRS